MRIGHIAGNITLPRTVALPTLVGVGAGVLLGLLFAAIVPVGGIQKWVFGPAFGGGLGWFITTFSPLRGESLMTWMGLQLNTLRRQRLVDGEPVLVAVGSGLIGREVVGPAVIVRSAVRVTPGSFDDRGVRVATGFTGAQMADGSAGTSDLAIPHSLQQAGVPTPRGQQVTPQHASHPPAAAFPIGPPAAGPPFPTGATAAANPFAQPPPAEVPQSRRRGRK